MSVENNVDIEYSPSFWSKRNPGVKRLEEHVIFIEKNSELVQKTIPCELNIRYGNGEREVYDIYGTDLPNGSPILIHFHGGFWQENCIRHNNNSFIAKQLYLNKIKSIFIGYELCPNVSFQELNQNTVKAFQNCLKYAEKTHTRSIHLSGHSAGAYIAIQLYKIIPNYCKSIFLLTGIYDLVPLLKTSYNKALKLTLDGATATSPLHQNFSPNKNCEIIVVNVKYDATKITKQGKDLYEQLIEQGCRCRFVLLEDMDHFDVVEGLYNEDNILLNQIIKYCV